MSKVKRYFTYFMCVIKIFLAFIYTQLHKKGLYAKDIWLIQEKHTEARDNGYYLFKYIRTKHPEINAYYSITYDSTDKYKVVTFGNIIEADSITHYIYYLSAKNSIGSQRYGACPYPTDWVNRFRFLCRRDQKVIFLQHGITINATPGLDYYKSRFDLFVCSAKPEFDYIHDKLHYPDSNVKMIGFCRYDGLNNSKPKKQILIMPTFRKWLASQNREMDATNEESKLFKESRFYKEYTAVLTNQSLLSAARNYGFVLVFYLHYALQSYTHLFEPYNNNFVRIADRYKYDVQQLMVDSSIMVTDYSSVFFDFAYMRKPEVFFQFDEDEFRKKHYEQGYYDYRIDGFGPVFIEVNDVVDYLIHLMESDCKMEQIYLDRVNTFFPFRDDCNCKRNYEAIRELG